MKNLLIITAFTLVSLGTHAQYLNWVKQITGAQTNYVKGMAVDGSGNIYLAGGFTGTIDLDPGAGTFNVTAAGGYDVWFAKYTSTGGFTWGKVLAGGGDDWATDIALDAAGNIYLSGWYNSLAPALDFNPDPVGVNTWTAYDGGYVAKYSNTGNFSWATVIGGTSSDVTRMNAIAVDGTGNVYTAGSISGNNTLVKPDPNWTGTLLNPSNGNIYYAKYNGTTGAALWAKNTGATNNTSAVANDVSLDASGNVYISGVFNGSTDFNPSGTSTNRASANGSAYIAKYTSAGAFGWSAQVTGQNGDEGSECVVDNSGNVFVVGKFNLNSQDIFMAKFSSAGAQQWRVLPVGGLGEDQGQSIGLDASGNVYLSGYFTGVSGNGINFNPLTSPNTFLNVPVGVKDFFISKYSTNGALQWIRNLDLTLAAGARQVNASWISNGNLIVAGALNGSGDFNSCAVSTAINASTDNGFFLSYTIDPLAVAGPSCVATTPSIYTLLNAPAGASITWSVSPSNLFSGPTSGTGPTANLTRNSGANGYATLTFTLNGVSAPCVSSITVNLTIGTPIPASLQVTVYGGQILNFNTANPVCPVGNNLWFYVAGLAFTDYSITWNVLENTGNAQVWVMDNGYQVAIHDLTQTLVLGATLVNACGSADLSNMAIYNTCVYSGSSVSVFPNPASSSLTISENSVSSQEQVQLELGSEMIKVAGADLVSETKLSLLSSFNELMWQGTLQEGKAEIETSSFPFGIYYLQVGDNLEKIRVIIQH